MGPPEEIFQERRVRELYDLETGFFDPLFGSVELPAPKGEAQTFVISGAGTGIPVFRRLQKEDCPFYSGILYTNDYDYVLARHLAREVITEKPFSEISVSAIDAALEKISKSRQVLCTSFPIGTTNRRIRILLEEAEKQGKLQRI